MRADDINRIIKNINQLPYNAILINGAWGIGKSYAINEALAGNSNVCKYLCLDYQMPKKFIMKYCSN